MFFLAGVTDEFKVEEAITGIYLVDYDVVRVIAVFPGAVLGALADGEDAVEEVVEFLGAGEVVLGDGVAHVPFRGVGNNQQGPAVFLFQ